MTWIFSVCFFNLMLGVTAAQQPTNSALTVTNISSRISENEILLGFYPDEPIAKIKMKAEGGDAHAQWFLGGCYALGQNVIKDQTQVVGWYRKSAKQGHAYAEYDLRICYINGAGVYQNYEAAAKWFRKEAQQGHTGAQYQLGLLYKEGDCVPQDFIGAYGWFSLAAAQGYKDASEQRDEVRLQMTPEQIAEAQELSRGFKPRIESYNNSTSFKNPTASGTRFFITDDGYLISNYHVVKEATNEFWIGVTPPFTNKANCSASVPMDGSTYSNFDANMDSITTNETINLLAGDFPTRGDSVWGPKQGMHILGAGMNLTRIYFPSNLVANGSLQAVRVLGIESPYHQTNVDIENMTVDANYQTGAVCTLAGVALRGSGITLKNVKFINGASFTTNSAYAEDWGLFIDGSASADLGGNLITGCIVSNYTCNGGNNLQGIGLIGLTSGIVTNCSAYQNTPSNNIYAFSPGSHDTTIIGCSAFDCAEGSHIDSAGYGLTNVTITLCNFSNTQNAVDWDSAYFTNLLFDSNLIGLKNGNGFTINTVIRLQASAFGQNFRVVNNSISFSGAEPVTTHLYLLSMFNMDGLYLCGNTYDASVLTNNFGGGVVNVTYCSQATTGPFAPNR